MSPFNVENTTQKRVLKKILTGFVILILFLFFNPFGIIGAGERGVRLRFGAVIDQAIDEGLYLRIPIADTIKIMDVKIQKDEVSASAASKDLQEVRSTVALNYHINPDMVTNIYQTVGMEYNMRIIAPAIQESVKAATAEFTAEELITRRSEVRERISTLLTEKIEKRGFIVDEFNLIDLDFSHAFNKAIEAKVTAEQNALKAENDLKRVEFEAKQKVTQATADAEAIRIQAQAITQQGGKDYVNLQWIEAWRHGGAEVPDMIIGEGGANFLYNLQ